MKPTYYGANVRIETQGNSLDGYLQVQRSNPLTNGWIDDRKFYQSDSYCHTDAKLYAAALAAKLHLENPL